MSLKSLIQRLLDSRTTPAQAGHASKPSSAVPVDYNPSASVDNWGPVLSNSTAVSDGYIWATGRTTSDKGFFQISTQALQITTTGTSNPGGEILNLFTPVSKGQLFSVYGRYLEQVTVRLVKTIGGYNLLIRRALSCLKPSSNFLPRSFCKAKNNGSAAKPFLIQELNSVAQQEGMSLQRTDTSVSSIQAAQEAVCFLTSTQERIQMCHRQIVVSETVGCLLRTLTWGLLSLLKKECQSILRRIQSQNRFGSVQRQGGVNFRTGGALC